MSGGQRMKADGRTDEREQLRLDSRALAGQQQH